MAHGRHLPGLALPAIERPAEHVGGSPPDGLERTPELRRLRLVGDVLQLPGEPPALDAVEALPGELEVVALEREQADLVLFGQQTSDGGGAVLWAAVADLLRLPVVSQTTSLELLDGSVRAVRQSEVGDDVVEAALPAIVAVTDAINELRYASLKGKMAAKKKPLDQLSLSDVGLGAGDVGVAGSRTEVLRIGDPPARPDAFRVEEEDRAAQVILDFLAERELV